MGKSYAQKVKAKQNRSNRNDRSREKTVKDGQDRNNKFPIAPVVVIVIVITLIIATIVMYQVQNGDDGEGNPNDLDNGKNGNDQPGDLPPHAYIGLESIDGNIVALDQFQGKVVIVDMFATWCGPCADQMEELIKLQDRFSESEMVILSVDTDLQETKDDVRNFRFDYPEARWTFVVSNPEFNQNFPASSIPTLYILDQNMEIALTEVGVTSANSLEQMVDQLL